MLTWCHSILIYTDRDHIYWLILSESVIMSAVTTGNAAPEAADPRQQLGEAVKARRLQLGISVRAAAESAGMARTTWISLEDASRRTAETNHAAIERTLKWGAGSLNAILRGEEPTPRQSEPDESVVHAERPRPAPQPSDDAVVRILRNPDLSDEEKSAIIRTLLDEQRRFAQKRADELMRAYRGQD